MNNCRSWLASLVFILMISLVRAAPVIDYCGGGDWSYEYSYYAIIDQRQLVDANFYPLLNCPDSSLCNVDMDSQTVNLESWKNYFGTEFSLEELRQLVYEKDDKWYAGVMDGVVESTLSRKLKQQKHGYFFDYLMLAKAAENSSSKKYEGTGWYQGEEGPAVDNSKILKQALTMMTYAPDVFMKHRVGFQAVRAAHYLQENTKAVNLFQEYFNGNDRDYMYYRAQEQAAGALFNLRKTQDAVAGFESAFLNMPDRRYTNALNLKISYEQGLVDDQGGTGLSLSDSYYFFSSFLGKKNDIQAIKELAARNVNSKYLDVLIARKIDQIQARIFEDGDGYYWLHDDTLEVAGLEATLVDLLNQPKLKKRKPIILLQSLLAIQSKEYQRAVQLLTAIDPNSSHAIDARRLEFIARTRMVNSIDRDAINHLFIELEKTDELHDSPAVVAAYFNTIANLYKESGDQIGGALIAVDYYGQNTGSNYDYCAAISQRRYNYEFDERYPLLETNIINKFQETLVNLEQKTAFEKLILGRLNVSPGDFANDLMGNYLLTQGEVKAAQQHYKKIKTPSDFWEGNMRPSIVSSSIKEWMNVDFGSISDNKHLEYENLVGTPFNNNDLENYKDNKIKLTELMLDLEKRGSTKSSNAADYNYMLGNIWYNMSVEGWFLNNLYYVGNNSRNPLKGYGWNNEPIEAKYQQVITRAGTYFTKAIQSKGSKETKAKATFALAKVNRCFISEWDKDYKNYNFEICGEHATYFDQLRNNYADTAYYQEILKECSWF